MLVHLETDLETVRRLAEAHRADFERLRDRLQDDDDLTDADIDAQMDALAAPIVTAVDCTTCANCCRSLDVYLTAGDAARLSRGTFIPISSLLETHIDRERARTVGEWGVFRSRPCSFLHGSLCSVYEHRPDSCRIYPAFTPDFRWGLDDMIDGAGLCPIIYNVLSRAVVHFRDSDNEPRP